MFAPKTLLRRILSRLTTPQAARVAGKFMPWLSTAHEGVRKFGLRDADRVLVVRLDEIGDVVMTTPFLRELRRNLPEAWITLVVKPSSYNLVETCPHVDEVLTFDWGVSGRLQDLKLHRRALSLAWTHLWSRQFDLAILPRWDTDYYHGAYVTYFSGAPRRVGYSERVNDRKKRENRGQDQLFTDLIVDRSSKHEVERNLELLEHLGGAVQDDHLELWTDPNDEHFAKRVVCRDSVRDEMRVVLCPGAGRPRRRWPVDRFVEVGRWLQERYKTEIVLVGGPNDEELGNYLEARLKEEGVINLINEATLRQTVASMRRCELYIGNDTGPMHLAVAAGLTIIEISCHPRTGDYLHPNSPKRFGPWRTNKFILQPNSSREGCDVGCKRGKPHCIVEVDVDEVKKTIESITL